MNYEFHPEALNEYEEAARFYAKKQCGLEQRFINSVESVIYKIIEAPLRYKLIEQDIHRCLTRVFPYAIFYTVEPEFILILAVTHTSREPGYWRNRVAQ
jgi:plasmid stabilization system protein ParE